MDLLSPVGWFERSGRVRLEVRGPGRAKFLNNVTTHDVKRLAPGQGREAFVTSLQGKTLGYVTLHAAEDRILLRTDPGGLEGILPHFQKYGLFDDVHWEDISDRTFEWHLTGRESGALLREVGAEVADLEELSHRDSVAVGIPIRIIREAPAGIEGWTLIGDRVSAPVILEELRRAAGPGGLVEPGPERFESWRIAAGTPVFGRDVTAENLPQEVGRDARAISYVKGCYLGQETVARIDALGHVNRILRGLEFPDLATPPTPGSILEFRGKSVATITSSAYAPDGEHPIALAYIRVNAAAPGTELMMERDGNRTVAIVAELPMSRPKLDDSSTG